MDPDATLKEVREIQRRKAEIGELLGADELPQGYNKLDEERADLNERLVDLYEALDEWKRRGGYDPQEWR